MPTMFVTTIPLIFALYVCVVQCVPCNKAKSGVSRIDYQEDQIFQMTERTYVNQVTIIQSSCEAKDSIAIQKSVTSLQESVITVSAVVKSQSFNSRAATTHKGSIAVVIASYSKIVTTLVTYSVHPGCHEKLKHITTHIQEVVNVFARLQVSLEQDVKSLGGINHQAFVTLDLKLNLAVSEETTYVIEEKEQTSNHSAHNGNSYSNSKPVLAVEGQKKGGMDEIVNDEDPEYSAE